MSTTTPVAALEALLRKHDWDYREGDGSGEDRQLVTLMAAVGEPLATAIWNRHAPADRRRLVLHG